MAWIWSLGARFWHLFLDACFAPILAWIWRPFLRPFWAGFWPGLEARFGLDLGPFSRPFWPGFGARFGNHFGDHLAWIWRPFWQSFWRPFGLDLAPVFFLDSADITSPKAASGTRRSRTRPILRVPRQPITVVKPVWRFVDRVDCKLGRYYECQGSQSPLSSPFGGSSIASIANSADITSAEAEHKEALNVTTSMKHLSAS